jgi:hypothetical protein
MCRIRTEKKHTLVYCVLFTPGSIIDEHLISQGNSAWDPEMFDVGLKRWSR